MITLPEFEKVFGAPPPGLGLSSKLRRHCRRQLKNIFDGEQLWQVINKDNTLYHGAWPDVPCRSFEEALRIANEKAIDFVSAEWEPHDDISDD